MFCMHYILLFDRMWRWRVILIMGRGLQSKSAIDIELLIPGYQLGTTSPVESTIGDGTKAWFNTLCRIERRDSCSNSELCWRRTRGLQSWSDRIDHTRPFNLRQDWFAFLFSGWSLPMFLFVTRNSSSTKQVWHCKFVALCTLACTEVS